MCWHLTKALEGAKKARGRTNILSEFYEPTDESVRQFPVFFTVSLWSNDEQFMLFKSTVIIIIIMRGWVCLRNCGRLHSCCSSTRWLKRECGTSVVRFWRKENRRIGKNSGPSLTLSTTNPILTGLGANPDPYSERRLLNFAPTALSSIERLIKGRLSDGGAPIRNYLYSLEALKLFCGWLIVRS